MFNLLLASYTLANHTSKHLVMNSQDPWGERPDDDKSKASKDTPPDLDELWNKLFKQGKSGRRGKNDSPASSPISDKSIVLIIAAIIAAWLATGFYTVRERENGVETVLGKYTATTKAGLNWNWPAPIGTVEKVDVTSISTMRVGEFKTQKGSISTSSQRNGQMLTSDENIVEIGAAVQYRISNPKNFLFQAEQPVDILENIVVSAIREVVGAYTVDEVLRDRRNEWPQQVKNIIDSTLKKYNLGFEIVAFELQDARAPAEVQDAFEDAVRAREDEERLRLQAEAFARERLPVARGRAAEMLEHAQAYKVNVLANAKADVSRFDNLLSVYLLDKDMMRERLYLESMAGILANTPKVFLDVANGSQPIVNLGGLLPQDELNRAIVAGKHVQQKLDSEHQSVFHIGEDSSSVPKEVGNSTHTAETQALQQDLRSRNRPIRN